VSLRRALGVTGRRGKDVRAFGGIRQFGLHPTVSSRGATSSSDFGLYGVMKSTRHFFPAMVFVRLTR
jgi:hypothetical protein